MQRQIRKVTFEDLFGHFNYSLEFHDSVTIIHGPNGCGKTTMLKIIDGVFNQRIDILKTFHFKTVEFEFSDESQLKIEREELIFESTESLEIPSVCVYFSYVLNGEKYKADGGAKEYVECIEKSLRMSRPTPYLERVSDDFWIDRHNDEEYTRQEVIEQFGPVIYRRFGNGAFDDSTPEVIQKFIDGVSVRLITADRLTIQKKIERRYNDENLRIEQRVDSIATEISEKINKVLQSYAQLSQARDQTFPLRAIQNKNPMTVEQIKETLVELEKKRKQFVETGILEETQEIDLNALVNAVTDSNRQILSQYATDTEEKLNELAELSSSINLFRTLIDNSFANKKIVFNKDKGFYFETVYSNTKIKPKNLSSGEQHEIVMFYDLIFNTSAGTLVLIDEPELSLHIKWQIDYVDKLMEIIQTSDFYVLLATHSPQIIHDKWDFTVALTNIE